MKTLQPLRKPSSKTTKAVSELRVKEYCNVERCYQSKAQRGLCTKHAAQRKKYGDNFLNHTTRRNEEEALNQDIDTDLIKVDYFKDRYKKLPQVQKALENLEYYLIMQRH